MDYDGDMDQGLAVSVKSIKGSVLDLDTDGEWKELETLKPNRMRSGVGTISVTAVDWNRDGYDDLLTSSVEGSVKDSAFLCKAMSLSLVS